MFCTNTQLTAVDDMPNVVQDYLYFLVMSLVQ